MRRMYIAKLQRVVILTTILACLVTMMMGLAVSKAHAATTVTYSATQTIPVPPASTYAGSGGGDGWAIALSSTSVYNVFHHSYSLTVACHLQSDASPCWTPETITDSAGNGFATPGQPGLWLDQGSGKLFVFATRTSDNTGGVVCIDTSIAATNPNPFCGFTQLTAVGEAPVQSGISAISAPAKVNNRLYAFNYVNGSGVNGSSVTGDQNKLLCFDLSTLAACASQPFGIQLSASGTDYDNDYPGPAVAAIAGHVIVPIALNGSDVLACYDPSVPFGTCAGSWPVQLGFGYDSMYGAPFPVLTSSGAQTGFCLPTGNDPCFDLSGATVATPAGMTAAISATSGWNGAALTVGPRVYVPNGNWNAVDCYDYATAASCANFPKGMSNLGLLYTVNPDPQRPACIWVNSDNGSGQIQNFDAYTGSACGQGPIRVLASSFVVATQLCWPASYTSLQVQSPPRNSYSSGTVAFEDGSGNPIPGMAVSPLDNTGTVDLSGLNFSTVSTLPQFLITLNSASSIPSAVVVALNWTGIYDPSCVKPGTTVTGGGPAWNCPTTPVHMTLQPVTVAVPIPPVTISPGVIITKPYQIQYGTLSLGWATKTPATPSTCTLSSTGDLPILMGLHTIFGTFLWKRIGTSRATAQLDFMGSGFDSSKVPTCDLSLIHALNGVHNDCFLGAPGSHPEVVRWHTDGFQETVNPPWPFHSWNVGNSGPLTYYVDITSPTYTASKFCSSVDVRTLVPCVETYIHTTLISRLPIVDHLAVVQEPPNAVLVRDNAGNLTGQLPGGQMVDNIPGSVYLPGSDSVGATVIIVNQPAMAYAAEVVGKPGANFTLVSSFADFTNNGLAPTVTAAVEQGKLGPSGVTASCFSADPTLQCVGVDIMPGSPINPINPKDNGLVEVAILGTDSVHASDMDPSSLRFGATGTETPAVRCRLEDSARYGTLVCQFRVSDAGFTDGDQFGSVTGTTQGGVQFTGSDAVRIVDGRA